MWLPVTIVIMLCAIVCVARIFIGPGAPTRLVAFDTTNTLVVALLVVLAIMFDQVVFVDVAIAYPATLNIGVTNDGSRVMDINLIQ